MSARQEQRAQPPSHEAAAASHEDISGNWPVIHALLPPRQHEFISANGLRGLYDALLRASSTSVGGCSDSICAKLKGGGHPEADHSEGSAVDSRWGPQNASLRGHAKAGNLQIIAHRGASGLAPENTMAAFRLAAELGAQAIETDVQMSRDARLMLIHDTTLRRTSNGRGRVSAKSFDELRRLDAGSWFPKRRLALRRGPRKFARERIPSIEELFALADEKNLHLYLEIKTPRRAGIEQALAAALRKADSLARSTVICFDAEVLRQVRKVDPDIPIGYLCEKRMANAATRAASLGAAVILPRADRVNADLVTEARKKQLQVITWTVNQPPQMKRLIALGVDGIMSDFPDRLATVVRAND
jgi:glycerophosphoryl diester phosphodiesterase